MQLLVERVDVRMHGVRRAKSDKRYWAGMYVTGLAGTTMVVAGRGCVTTTGSAGCTVVQALSPRMASTKAIRIAFLLYTAFQ